METRATAVPLPITASSLQWHPLLLFKCIQVYCPAGRPIHVMVPHFLPGCHPETGAGPSVCVGYKAVLEGGAADGRSEAEHTWLGGSCFLVVPGCIVGKERRSRHHRGGIDMIKLAKPTNTSPSTGHQDQTAQLVGPRGNSREATTAPSRRLSRYGPRQDAPAKPRPSLCSNGRKLQLPVSPSRSPIVPV